MINRSIYHVRNSNKVYDFLNKLTSIVVYYLFIYHLMDGSLEERIYFVRMDFEIDDFKYAILKSDIIYTDSIGLLIINYLSKLEKMR